MRLPGADLHLPPRSFFQTNTEVAAALYAQAAAWADAVRPSSVWDLYCGVGGFALHLAAPGRTVLGIESSAEAVAGARRSAADAGLTRRRLRGRRRHGGGAGRARRRPTWSWSTRPGAAPARSSPAGWSARASRTSCTPAATPPRWPATWPPCRRCGPRLGRLLDMFPQTSHHEVLLLLSRDDLPAGLRPGDPGPPPA